MGHEFVEYYFSTGIQKREIRILKSDPKNNFITVPHQKTGIFLFQGGILL